MTRKNFLATAGLSAFSISAFGSVRPGAGDLFVADCATTNDILGPFYRPDAPLRQDLTSPGLPGSVIQLSGTVFGADCTTPLVGALIEIWHCDTRGEYDNESADFQLRARWITDEAGTYSFRTILPGKYLNGEKYRPAHIHYRVTAPDSRELVSQLYFHGDPHITADPWASRAGAERRILPIALLDTVGNLAVSFDIYLPRA